MPDRPLDPAIAARLLAAIIESSDDAIVSKDLTGVVTSWNRAAERIFGYTADEMIGQSIRKLIPDELQADEDMVLSRIVCGEKVDHFETIRQRKDGSRFPVSITVSPVRDGNGVIVGASKIARDMTDRRNAEAERERLVAIARQKEAITARLNRVGADLASNLDLGVIVQTLTDAGRELTRAEFAIFDQTQRRPEVVRSDDVTGAPFPGLPAGSQLRSYLAVPVVSPGGVVLGGLVFGHSRAAAFTDEDEQIALGIASWASIALENARLYVASQEASRVKDDFLATLSHELRTPLNAILGYARMMRAGIVTPERRTKAVETIERNATSLTQIVEDVLDVSRITSGKLRLQVQRVALPDLLANAVDAVMPAADARGVRVESVVDPQAGPVAGDPERLQQVIWNLVSNAVKFTGKEGRVQVRLARVNSHVEIVVADNGVGIAQAFLPHVFERFRQADSGTTRERGGLGLGLAIARQLIELHGGTIAVASDGEGRGAAFTVRLPVMLADPAELASERAHPRTERSQPEILLPNLKGIRVLAVDDDRDALALVRDILQTAGAHVDVADSAAAAFR